MCTGGLLSCGSVIGAAAKRSVWTYRRPVQHPSAPDRAARAHACSLCAGRPGGRDTKAGGRLQRLERLTESGVARLTKVGCLDGCECGDIVVARPTGACRGAGARPVCFERLAGDEATAELADWLRSGGLAQRSCPVGSPATSSSVPTRCPAALRRSRQHSRARSCPARGAHDSSSRAVRTFIELHGHLHPFAARTCRPLVSVERSPRRAD